MTHQEDLITVAKDLNRFSENLFVFSKIFAFGRATPIFLVIVSFRKRGFRSINYIKLLLTKLTNYYDSDI